MTGPAARRPLPAEVVRLIDLVASTVGPAGDALMQQARNADAIGTSSTMLDIVVSDEAPVSDLRDGPINATALVYRGGELTGEILVWMRAGYLDGIEQAWYTDDRPLDWPRPNEVRLT